MDLSKISFVTTISPYAKDFENHVDKNIREIVLTLVNKGYLPSSSCEGHTSLNPRYIVLCFGSIGERTVFKEHFRFFSSTESETQSSENFEGHIITHQDRNQEIKGYNYLFFRNYEQYWFLRIYIGAYFQVTNKNWIEIKLKQLFTIAFNLIFRKVLTYYFLKRSQKLSPSAS